MPAAATLNPPAGWTEDRKTGTVACPHRDLFVCPDCASSHVEAVEVAGAHFWIADVEDRAMMAEMLEMDA